MLPLLTSQMWYAGWLRTNFFLLSDTLVFASTHITWYVVNFHFLFLHCIVVSKSIFLLMQLAGGMLTGKYSRADSVSQPEGRFWAAGNWAEV